MHECPNCGMACDCDNCEVWNGLAAIDCECTCEDEFESDYYEDMEDE